MRWEIELFFRWIKQHLKVKSFVGRSENAVLSQIYGAMITFLLIVLYRLILGLEAHSLLAVTPLLKYTLDEPVRERWEPG